MRSLAYVVAGLFLIYSIKTPNVVAAEAPQFNTVDEAIENTVRLLEDADFRFLDESLTPISANDLIQKPFKTFYLDGPFRVRAKIGDIAQGVSISLTATDLESGKVLGRRNLQISMHETVAAARVRFDQTIQSLEKEIARKGGFALKKTTAWSQVKLALTHLLGVPEAHAGVKNLLARGLLMGIGVVAIIVAAKIFKSADALMQFGAIPTAGAVAIAGVVVGAGGLVIFGRGIYPAIVKLLED